MEYKKPSIDLLSGYLQNNESLKSDAESINKRILQCFLSQDVSVTEAGYSISPINMVFNYSISTGTSLSTIKNLKDDISYAAMRKVKIF